MVILGIRRSILWVQEVFAASVVQNDSKTGIPPILRIARIGISRNSRNSCQDVMVVYIQRSFQTPAETLPICPSPTLNSSATEDFLISTRPGGVVEPGTESEDE